MQFVAWLDVATTGRRSSYRPVMIPGMIRKSFWLPLQTCLQRLASRKRHPTWGSYRLPLCRKLLCTPSSVSLWPPQRTPRFRGQRTPRLCGC